MMRLYTFIHSPGPVKVQVALSELGLEYEPVEVTLPAGGPDAEARVPVSLHLKVPVLEHDGRIFREANAIIAYLGDVEGDGLWPPEPAGRGQALQWLFFESSHLATDCGAVWFNDVVAPAVGQAGCGAEPLARATKSLQRSLSVLDTHLGANRFVLGERFCLADCALGVSLALLRGTRLEEPRRWRNIAAYRAAIMARPSWRAAHGEALYQFGRCAAGN